MFSDELEKISWEETTKAIYSKTDADVRRALGKKEHLDVNDFMALISPAATPYLEVMARLSQKYTQQVFPTLPGRWIWQNLISATCKLK